jgi:hypothetical protein
MKIKDLLENMPSAPKTSAPADFVSQNYDTAVKVGDQLGVDPKIILGHWALETGWGKSVIPGTNNLGNIKDFSGKTGVKAYDKVEKSNDAYRQYASTDDFATDYASLLARRFPGVVGSGSDKDAFIQGLQGGQYKYATGGAFEKSMAAMPSSVEKYLNPDNKWSMDPGKMMARIQTAPAAVKNYISQNFPSVEKFVSTVTSSIPALSEPSEEQVEIIINGKKLKFKNKKEAALAVAKAQAQGLDVQDA